jgi:imidazolonepropionase-like amidohydrolase
LVDGPESCYKAVRNQFRAGADFIKIFNTGRTKFKTPQFSPEELKIIVEEAARHETYVSVHAHVPHAVLDALKAGCKCIEHGYFMDDECIELMAKMDATLDPTLYILKTFNDYKVKRGVTAQKTADESRESHATIVQKAKKAGIRIVLGSDFIGYDHEESQYGYNAREFIELVDAGLSPMEAIIAGTRNGAYLMLRDDIGTLESGKLADIVLVEGDPLKDISVLSDPDNIKVVVKDGMFYKNKI